MKRLRVISSYVIKQTWVKTGGTDLMVGEENLGSPKAGRFKRKAADEEGKNEESQPQVNI